MFLKTSGLLKTLQQKQKFLEYREVLDTNSPRTTEKQSDPHQSVTLEYTSDTLSYDSKDPLLSSVKPQCLSHSEQAWTTNVQSDARKLGEFRATLTANSFINEHSNKSSIIQGTRLLSTASLGVKEAAVQNVVKTSKGKSRSKKKKASAPFIEHQEDKRTSFSRASFVTLQERLSADEMHILSQLARALSLPDDVRHSLHAYLDRQKGLDDDDEHSSVDEGIAAGDYVKLSPAAKSKKRKKVLKTQSLSQESIASTSSEPFWSVEDVKDPERLKTMLERTAKVLSSDKQQLLEQAVEHERQMKENAYHDKMASFVELCINTGMVSTVWHVHGE